MTYTVSGGALNSTQTKTKPTKSNSERILKIGQYLVKL